MTQEQPKIAVIGAGLMGHGIAYLFAAAGHKVRVHDIDADALVALPDRIGSICELLQTDTNIADRISGHGDIGVVVGDADFVFEAALENLALKQDIFTQTETLATETAILCSNTSVIPISDIAGNVKNKHRVVGTHFWNPPHLVRLVEVVLMGEENAPAAAKVEAVLKQVGQHPVRVNKDIPGFIGNRLQHALKREAIAMVASGVCDAQTIDDVVKMGFGARMAVLGPMEQSDLVGLDLTKAIHDTLMPDLDVTPVAHPFLDELVASGQLGMKSGQGLRRWGPGEADAVRQRLAEFLASSARQNGNKKNS